MNLPHFPSLEAAHYSALNALMSEDAIQSSPRGMPIRELIGGGFVIENPRNRIITNKDRAANYGFAVGELCWYVRGNNDLATMLYYNKRMAMFSDDNKTINSAYGSRMFDSLIKNSQFENVLQELKNDPDSRRALMLINNRFDLEKAVTHGSKDVPCTVSIQLLVRNRKLHMVANMRSNDIIWGLPYDVFSFTSLQEAICDILKNELGIVDDVGTYTHLAGSLHIYERHFELAKKILESDVNSPAPMSKFTDVELQRLAYELEPAIRSGDIIDKDKYQNSSDFSDSFKWMLEQLLNHSEKRKLESLEKA